MNSDNPHATLELIVNNHPGVLSHVCGLLARRAYNLEAIVTLPIGDGARSRIWLRLDESVRLSQVINQLLKLHDVHEVHSHPGSDVFGKVSVAIEALAG